MSRLTLCCPVSTPHTAHGCKEPAHACGDFLVELRGFEPLTSGVEARAVAAPSLSKA
jgi:hypothetical protein